VLVNLYLLAPLVVLALGLVLAWRHRRVAAVGWAVAMGLSGRSPGTRIRRATSWSASPGTTTPSRAA
jgi:hypothetical protein